MILLSQMRVYIILNGDIGYATYLQRPLLDYYEYCIRERSINLASKFLCYLQLLVYMQIKNWLNLFWNYKINE